MTRVSSSDLSISPHSTRHGLVLCASLVENPMNLGAICRTAEVMRLESLVLPNLSLITNWEFRKLAVSAHQWQPLVACPPEQLANWIGTQQHQGYTVLALAPPPASLLPPPASCPTPQLLPKVAFPRQTVLVLGRELTGIPSEIVAQCDGAISIPQYGLVDSLNVATAAAIAAYEYVRQWGQLPPT